MCLVTIENEIIFSSDFFFLTSCMSLVYRNAVYFCQFVTYLPTGLNSVITYSAFSG